eukprot:g6763.t1
MKVLNTFSKDVSANCALFVSVLDVGALVDLSLQLMLAREGASTPFFELFVAHGIDLVTERRGSWEDDIMGQIEARSSIF